MRNLYLGFNRVLESFITRGVQLEGMLVDLGSICNAVQ